MSRRGSISASGGLRLAIFRSASGIRMVYEIYKQMQGKAGPRQVKKADIGLTHNIGGIEGYFNCAVAIFGRRD